MDKRLMEAAQTGDVDSLLSLIKEHPLILRTVALFSGDTPLHIASTAGQLDFVKLILKLRKEFAAELNQDGFSPLHIASANGDIEIVKELLEADQSLCRIKGREGRIPLHYAAIKGRVVVIRELVSACADSVEDTTSRGETPLHLAVKNNQFEAFKVLVEHLMQHNKEGVLKKEDESGNTVLHIAVSKKQHEVIDFLLNERNVPRGVMELNSKNKRGFTALDVLPCCQSEAGDREIEEIPQQAGAARAVELNSSSSTVGNRYEIESSRRPKRSVQEFINYSRIEKKDWPTDVTNCLLVIAALTATATYQAVLSPPGGAWQDNSSGGGSGTGSAEKPHTAGHAIMESSNSILYGFFLLFNTYGFSVSIYIMMVLTNGFPMEQWLGASLLSIVITYDLALAAFTAKTAVSICFVVYSIAMQISIPYLWGNERLCCSGRRIRKATSSTSNEPIA